MAVYNWFGLADPGPCRETKPAGFNRSRFEFDSTLRVWFSDFVRWLRWGVEPPNLRDEVHTNVERASLGAGGGGGECQRERITPPPPKDFADSYWYRKIVE